MSGEPPSEESRDEYALRQLREGWKHFDAEGIMARQSGFATPGLTDALRAFTTAVLTLRREFATIRKLRCDSMNPPVQPQLDAEMGKSLAR